MPFHRLPARGLEEIGELGLGVVPEMKLDPAAVRENRFVGNARKERAGDLGPMAQEGCGVGQVLDGLETHHRIETVDFEAAQHLGLGANILGVGVRIVFAGVGDGLGACVNRDDLVPGLGEDVGAIANTAGEIENTGTGHQAAGHEFVAGHMVAPDA